MTGERPAPPAYIPFRGSARDEQRREYVKWLVTKIAACFEVDLLVFNLSETITKANGGNLTAKTDQGLLALADTIAMFITREILWVIDPTHKHGFQFTDITPRDVTAELEEDKALMAMGATTPNEVRAKRGLDPFPGSEGDIDHWANNPYPFQDNVTLPPEEDVIGNEPTDPDDDEKPGGKSDPDDPDNKPSKPSKK